MPLFFAPQVIRVRFRQGVRTFIFSHSGRTHVEESGSLQTGHGQEGIGGEERKREKKGCRLVIMVSTEPVNGVERICKEKSVSELNVWVWAVVFFSGPFLSAFAELRRATVGFVMSVCPHGTAPLPLDVFS